MTGHPESCCSSVAVHLTSIPEVLCLSARWFYISHIKRIISSSPVFLAKLLKVYTNT